MSLQRSTWEAIVRTARSLSPTEGTVKAIRFAMSDFNMRFLDQDAEYHFIIALERAINGPRPFPTFIPPVAVKRLDPSPAIQTPIPLPNLPREAATMVSAECAREIKRRMVFSDRSPVRRTPPPSQPKPPARRSEIQQRRIDHALAQIRNDRRAVLAQLATTVNAQRLGR